MPAALPVFARGKGPDSVASYDWLDLTSGAGYKRFYPCQAQRSGAVDKVLSGKLFDGVPTYNTIQVTNATPAQLWLDYDFDIEMKVPSIISGEATLNMTHRMSGS